ncbi:MULTISPECIES: hypothetical protein [Colwellia]|uniref:hypothetical protein n=1 Tax=Colwellia TaxID=28228 RepID=UPI000ADFCD7E|nr:MULTISPECIES: hypothetical protein [Colwellia]
MSEVLGNKVRPLTVDPLLKLLILEISSWPEDYKETAQTQRFILVLLDRLAMAKVTRCLCQLFKIKDYYR